MRLPALAIACLGCVGLGAEHLPIRTYTTADGLPADQVQRITIDSRGFVWFATPEGLSRFDGYRFVNFGVDQGLAHRDAQAFLETRSGDALVATPRGLCRFHNGGERNRFVTYLPDAAAGPASAANNITALLESSSGRVWCGTMRGLFEFSNGTFRRQALPDPPPGWKGIEINDLAEDSCGKLWLGTTSGIYVIAKDGAAQRLIAHDGLPGDYVNAFAAVGDKMWAGMRGGLARLRDGCSGGAPGIDRVYPHDVALNAITLAHSPDGALWIGTGTGLVRLRSAASDHESIEKWTRAQGLADRSIFALAAGKGGNIWAGTEGGGVMSIQPDGFTTFNEQDGLRSDRVWSVFEDRAGRLVAVTASDRQSGWRLNIFDGAKFQSQAAPGVFGEQPTWGNDRILLQARSGEWWAATSQGLCRYAPGDTRSLAGRAPVQCFFSSETIFQIFEDSKGGIWAASQARPGAPTWDRLMRWDPATQKLIAFDDFPHEASLVKAFAEDRAGNIWMGEWGGGLIRYDGRRFTHFDAKDGVPGGTIFALLTDRRGGLWIASGGGLGWIENPAVEPLRTRVFTRSDGLSSNTVRAVVEDNAGFLYAATGTGVDRLNPRTGRFKHFSAADGLGRGETESAIRDRAGNVWMGTTLGISRLLPGEPRTSAAPSVFITSLQTGGVAFPVSHRGETAISRIELEPSQNQLQVEFAGFGEEAGLGLRYTYMLQSSDPDWSAPREQHVVNYAALAAGTYRFLVKAVNSDGGESTPAEVQFLVLPPVWRRAWFEALAIIAVASIVYLLHRYRVAQMVSLERMRTAIATDLHDDIGASLSQIAILSEVARAGMSPDDRLPQESLRKVSTLARELVDSMSDIVWSIRVEPDEWDSLVRRMREFALDVLGSQGIDFELDAAPHGETVHISLQARRQLFLMFKECVHNASRHSGCTAVRARLNIARGEISMVVSDNGRGMNPVEPKPVNGSAGGTGLPGMRRRTAALDGTLLIDTKPGEGCTITIRIPLRRAALRFGHL